MSRWPHAAELRAACWASRALREARGKLAAGRLCDVELTAPANVPASGGRGVEAVLRLRRHTCLEGALVRQSWLAAHGVRRAVVIGVGPASDDFLAHAWLDGEDDVLAARFSELTRLLPR